MTRAAATRRTPRTKSNQKEDLVEVKIGIQYAPREITLEVAESVENVEKLIADSVAAGGVLTLTDAKGRKLLVPADKLAYVEIGHGVAGQVGFRS